MANHTAGLVMGESTLYASDIALVIGSHWWNDHIIGFAFAVLGQEFSNCLFVQPATSFMLANSVDLDDVKEAIEELDVPSFEYIFFPVNDNPFLVESGGSHWSLLVYRTTTMLFKHYDSCWGSNTSACQAFYSRISSLLRGDLKLVRNSPQQQNGYDCGVHIVAIAHNIAAGEVGVSIDAVQWRSFVYEQITLHMSKS